ncbi:DEAD/DEAH box helicase [Streptomyces mirabilis]|uniref:DEAD/DEAH box helicase n=1 Tax=Streptomyces mirabilis TaxID=68239 RepID=UPI0036747A83
MTLPVALSGSDVIGQAKTGTGKTLGFGLPLLERVTVPADVEAGRAQPEQLTDAPQALVVVPTRELCTQVTNDLLTAGKVRNVRVLAIYGGRAYEPQVEALKKGVDVIVGTPGRLLDLAGQKKLNLKHIKALVLDEADEMLDLGFLPDVEKIMNMLPARRQTMLFSATMPGAVIGLARRYMSQPTHIRATAPDDEGATVRNTAQFIYRAHNMDKPELVARILQADGRGLAMVFCRTKRTAADLADQLQQRGFASGAVHGDLGQGAREQALRAFRNGKVDVLVCTDVAARGIDVEGVTHVINYQSPEDEKTYLHRIGRTGRAGAKGIAITLVDWDDIPRWQLINKALDLGFGNPPETYSTSPHLFEELNIPAGTKGVLPRSERTRAGLAAEEVEDLGETGGRGGARGRGGPPPTPPSPHTPPPGSVARHAVAEDHTFSHADRAHPTQVKDSFTVRQLGTAKAVGVRNQAGAVSVGCSVDAHCRSVALSFQIVTLAGQNTHLNAVNLSNATNEHCDGCQTLAGAYQFVVSTARPFTLDATAQRKLADIHRRLDDLTRSKIPAADLKAQADSLAAEVTAVLHDAVAGAPKAPDAPAVAVHRHLDGWPGH